MELHWGELVFPSACQWVCSDQTRFSNEQQYCSLPWFAFGMNIVKEAGWVLVTEGHTPPQITCLVQSEYTTFNGASASSSSVLDMRWQRGLTVEEYLEETISWMLFYHFGNVNGEVKGAVLASGSVDSYCFNGLPACKSWMLVLHACFTSYKQKTKPCS